MSDDGFGPREGGAYRGEIPRCPACGDALEPTLAGSAEIDVCPRCGGIWFDWTDGDLASLARRATEGAAGPLVSVDTTGDGSCPRCREPLGEDTVRGIAVGRCASCAGAFVSRAAIDEIVARVAVDPEPDGPSLLARVVAWFMDFAHPTRALLRNAGVPAEGDERG